jgi:hypothetical protein
MGIEQPATEGEIVAALAVGEEAVVANPVEGKACSRKRRMNSSASSVISLVLPSWR